MSLFSNIQRLPQLDVSERRVFVRADLDVVVSSFGGVVDDTELRRALPTLRYLVNQRSKVIVGAHYGTAAQPAPENTPRCVARRLTELLGAEVVLLERDFAGQVGLLEPGQIALTPNLLDYSEELEGDAVFAHLLARSLDVYVGDGLRSAALSVASVTALPRALSLRGAGLRLAQELDLLELLADPPAGRYVAVVGGDSFARKSRLLWALLLKADAVLLGGVVANTCLAAQGWRPGQSAVEVEQLDAARAWLDAARGSGVTVSMPQDALVVDPRIGLDSLISRDIQQVAEHEAVVDIGMKTCARYREALCYASTVVCSGLMGAEHSDATLAGTYRVWQAATTSAASTAIFGARSVATADRLDVLGPFGHAPSGGSASLALMSGTVLPGVESLRS